MAISEPHDPPQDSDADAHLAAALAEYQSAVESGTPPDRAAFFARFPDLAERLANCLDAMEAVRVAVTPPPQSAGSPTAALEADAAVGGYRIVRELGRGGMGVVYEAIQESLGRRVALKVLPFAAATDERAVQRFRHEAQAAAALHHPHIVPVYEVGTTGHIHYFAMQLIDGRSLAVARQGSTGRPSAPETNRPGPETPADPHSGTVPTRSASPADGFRQSARLIAVAADALHHAHECGIVHRDVKPGNLLLDVNGHLWVADFGLAKLPGSDLTGTADVMGTVRYMSPEQAAGRTAGIDARSDVYSLGVTLYELLAGAPAFDADDRRALLRKVLEEEPIPPRKRDRRLPADLETVCLKAMAKDPAERYQTAAAFRDDLERFLSDRPIIARPPTLAQRGGKWVKRNRVLVGATLAAAFFALSATAVVAGIAADRVAREKELTDEANGELRRTNGQLVDSNEAKDQALYTANFLVARKAWLDGDLATAQRFLNLCPDPRRGWEWRYLRPRTESASAVLRHTNKDELTAELSANGLVAVGNTFAKPLFHVRRMPARLDQPPPPAVEINVSALYENVAPQDAHLSPDNTLLLGQRRNHLAVVWDTTTGREVQRHPLPIKTPFGDGARLQFGPNGLETLAHADGLLTVWSVTDRRPRVRIACPDAAARVVYVDDGRQFILVAADRLELRDAATGRLLAGHKRPPKAPSPRAFSPTGQHFATVANQEVVVWEVATGKELRTLRGHFRGVSSLAFSPDGSRLATGDGQRLVKVWDLVRGDELASIRQNAMLSEKLAFWPDGHTLTCGCLIESRVWDTLALRDGELVNVPGVRSLMALSSNGQVAVATAGADDGGSELRLIEFPTGRLIRVLSRSLKVSGFDVASFAEGGQRVAAKCPDGQARVWDTDTGRVSLAVECPPAAPNRPLLSSDGRRLAVYTPAAGMRVYDVSSGRTTHAFPASSGYESAFAFSRQSDRLAYGLPDDTFAIRDLRTDQTLPLPGSGGKVYGAAFHPDGTTLATAGWDGVIRTWSATDGSPRLSLEANAAIVKGVAYSPDGARLASTGQDQTVRVFHATSGEEYLTFRDWSETKRIQFTADGQLLGVTTGNEARIWRGQLASGNGDHRRTRSWYRNEHDRLRQVKWHPSAAWFAERLLTDEIDPFYRRVCADSLSAAGRVSHGDAELLLTRFERFTLTAELPAAYRLAARFLEAADLPRYRRLCDAMQEQMKKRGGPFELSVALRLACLGQRPPGEAAAVVEQVRTRLKDYPDTGVYQHVLGMALYRAGQHDEAVRTLKTAEKGMKATDGGQAVNWLFLAMACHAAGQKDEALQWLKKADEWYPTACAAGLTSNGKLPFDERAAISFPVLRREAATLLGVK